MVLYPTPVDLANAAKSGRPAPDDWNVAALSTKKAQLFELSPSNGDRVQQSTLPCCRQLLPVQGTITVDLSDEWFARYTAKED
jgi:hypothetical protein